MENCAVTHIQACPGCGTRSENVSLGRGSAFSTSSGGQSYEHPDYEIHECKSCGILYKNRTISESTLTEYYSHVDFTKWEIPGLFPTERRALAELEKLTLGSRILDFGCSSGRLLSALRPGYQRFGIELNQTAAREAESKGITMLSFANLDDEAPFDAVVLVDVFEHLADPSSILARLAKRLRPHGKLILVTGDGDNSLCRRLPAEFWYFRNVEHLCMLTRRFADHLATTIPLQLVGWERVSHYDSTHFNRVCDYARVFAYLQCQSKTILWRLILQFAPFLGRASHWQNCPAYDQGADHIVGVFVRSVPV